MASLGSLTSTPEVFHLETKYIVLSYLGLPSPSMPGGACASELPAEARSVPEDREDERCRITEEVREELQRMEGSVSTWFSSTDPRCSVGKSLASLGLHVAHELQEHLGRALQTLLSAPLDYELYKAAVQDVSTHAEGGWTKVLVPLVLLHALHEENQPLETLVSFGVHYLEEAEADYIIRQGGWGSVIKGDPCDAIAEDCDDICILSMEQQPDRPSPPASPSGTERGEPCSWQTGSPPISLVVTESWSQVDVMDPEDIKSLDGNEGAVLAEEHSENNSSNSDIVHVEREEAELLESGAEGEEEEAEEEAEEEGAGAETVLPELQESLLSVLGGESELMELKVELSSPAPSVGHTPSFDPTPSVGHTPSFAPAPTVNPPPLPLEATETQEPLASEQTNPIPADAILVSHMESSTPDAPMTAVPTEPPPPAQDLPPLLMEADLVPEPESELPGESLQHPILSAEVQLQPTATAPPKASAQESCKAPPGESPLQPKPAATTPPKASAQESCKAPPGESPLQPKPAATTPPKASAQESIKAPPGESPLQPQSAATTPPKASAQESIKAPPGESPLQTQSVATTPPKASAQESCKAPPGEASLQPKPAATTPRKASAQAAQESCKVPPGEAPLQPQPAATTPPKTSAQESCKVPPGEAPLKLEPQPPESSSPSELSVLLYGGAALVAIAAVLAYGAFLYRRK